jgi:hypothetical protein
MFFSTTDLGVPLEKPCKPLCKNLFPGRWVLAAMPTARAAAADVAAAAAGAMDRADE